MDHSASPTIEGMERDKIGSFMKPSMSTWLNLRIQTMSIQRERWYI